MDDFTRYMQARLERSKAYHEIKGRQVNLTLEEYFDLHTPGQLRTLRERFEDNSIASFSRCKWGYVLGWRDRGAFQAGVLDRYTAQVLTREASRRATFKQKGDRHTDEVRRRISAKLRGRKQQAGHVQKRAAVQRGVKRGPMSQEHKEAIRAGKARRAAALATSARSVAVAAPPTVEP
jgi:hypothetical protein